MSDELARDAKNLAELVAAIDVSVRGPILDLDQALIAFGVLEQANRDLADARRFLADRLGDEMGTKRVTVTGAATFERMPRREGSTKCMDEEGLWRQVLDTRIVDRDTGEVIPQSEIIRMVYGSLSKETGKIRLTGASPTKVELVGIDPELFFEKPDRVGWSLQVK
jgi:hypothetical protein